MGLGEMGSKLERWVAKLRDAVLVEMGGKLERWVAQMRNG